MVFVYYQWLSSLTVAARLKPLITMGSQVRISLALNKIFPRFKHLVEKSGCDVL
jgi:hypothetical protein